MRKTRGDRDMEWEEIKAEGDVTRSEGKVKEEEEETE